MTTITERDFMAMQPAKWHVGDSNKYYLDLAQRLARLWDESQCFASLPEGTRRAVVLAVVGYYQDVVSDAGVWRSFVAMHEHLYGTPLPFYGRSDDYVDFELNRDDLRFVIWYTIEGQQLANYRLSPLDADVKGLADLFFTVLDAEYVQAPAAADYTLTTGVDPTDTDDAEAISELGRWLFYDCYLLKPAAKQVMRHTLHQMAKILADKAGGDVMGRIDDLRDRTMLSYPTGPLSLSIGQWIKMIASNELPSFEREHRATPHPLYEKLMRATGGKEIAFFATYRQLTDFLTGPMGWPQEPGGIFPQFKDSANFVVLANRDRGMLIAHDVAQYFAHEDNPAYDPAAAAAEGHKLVTEQGRCPVDLVKYAFRHGMLPDAVLPGDDTGHLLHDNWDFLMRLYQQSYYND